TIDATDPTGPTIVSAIPFAGAARGIELVDDLAVVAAGTGGVVQFSLTTPDHPLLLGAQDRFLVGGALSSPDVQEVRIAGRYGILSADIGQNTTHAFVVDLSAPGVPVLGEEAKGGFPSGGFEGQAGVAVLGTALAPLGFAPPSHPHWGAAVEP